jgi:predicted nucleic acid-binding protein
MASVLVDSCVVLDLADPDSQWFEWSATTLEQLDESHRLVINPIIYAECSVGYDTIEAMDSFIEQLDFAVMPLPREALFLAGKAFMQYRKNKGGKGNVLPDFFIGAQAAVEQLHLVTRDITRYETYFPTVKLIAP